MPTVAHFIAYTGTAMGGPVVGLAGYTALLTEAGYGVTVYSARAAADGKSVALDARVRCVQAPAASWAGLRRAPALWQQAGAAPLELLHSHGLWTDVNRLAGDLARRRHLPHLLAPCGMLATDALRYHAWKKIPARLWFQNRALREAHCLHAKSEKEYVDIRAFGLRAPVAIVANPILPPPWYGTAGSVGDAVGSCADGALPQGDAQPFAREFRHAFRIPEARRIVLFLGRLHPVKGPARLVEAWSVVQARHPEWLLVLAGPDQGGYRRAIEALAVTRGCKDRLSFTGELHGAHRWGALAAAEVFVMPSDFENFGNAIVEAMWCGVPVITTTGTPWQALSSSGAGWWVKPTAESVASALDEALALSAAQRLTMGGRALNLARQFAPEQAVQDLIQVYQWLLAAGARPACVKAD